VGLLVSVQGIGAVAGGVTAARLARRLGDGGLVAAGLLACAAGAALQAPALLGSVLGGVVLFGASTPWILVGLTTMLQRLTPAVLQGRVYSAADALVTTPQTISIALGAGLIAVVGYRALLAVMAAVMVSCAAYLFSRLAQQARRARGTAYGRNATGSVFSWLAKGDST
jgi:MFS family permease